MIIELNGNREGKPLCHVTMHGSKISGSQHNCVPANMAGIKKKIDMYDCPLHDCTATQESNKTVTQQDKGTTQQQKNDQTSHCGAHVLTEQWRFQRRGAAPLVLDESRGPHG